MQVVRPNWQGMSRSNYVKVKDLDELQHWLDIFGLSIYHRGERSVIYVADRWPDWGVRLQVGPEELDVVDVTFDPAKHIMPFLYKDQVLITMTVGFDGLHELMGEACAYHPDGRMLYLGLDEIYNTVGERFTDVNELTQARG